MIEERRAVPTLLARADEVIEWRPVLLRVPNVVVAGAVAEVVGGVAGAPGAVPALCRAVAAGIAGLPIGSLIGSALATPAYGYGYPAYGYPAYGYGYSPYAYAPVQTVTYAAPAPAVVVRRRVVYRTAPAYRRVIVRRAYGYGPRVAVYRPRAQFYRPAMYRQRVVYGGRPAYHRAAVRVRSFRTY